ncbi:MAG: prepilin-type N-terminal cleavage/methylation domain-containing protein [Candidatus Omnitrophota bacterium]
MPPLTASRKHIFLKGFTLIELIMIIVIIGIIAAIAIPKFVDLRERARNAAREGNIAALRSAAFMYYGRSALEVNLCDADTNSYRNVSVAAPCFPASYDELEAQLVSPLEWPGAEKACYDSSTGEVESCQ